MKKLIVLLLTLFALNSCEEDTTIIDATADKKLPKVNVCHYDADTDTWKTISVNRNALKAHLAHGDKEGSCDELNTYIPDDAFETFLIEEGYDEYPLDDYVLTANLININSLDFMDGVYVNNIFFGKIRNMTGIKDFSSLTHLNLDSNEITELDVSGLKNLEMLDISFNNVSKLNLNGLTSLETLYCTGNQMTDLDFTGLSKLYYVEAYNNLLNSINLSGASSLKDLSLGWNELTELDVSDLTNLEFLSVYANKLLTLKANNAKTLLHLYADKNPDLNCIEVFEGVPPQNTDVDISYFSEDCGY